VRRSDGQHGMGEHSMQRWRGVVALGGVNGEVEEVAERVLVVHACNLIRTKPDSFSPFSGRRNDAKHAGGENVLKKRTTVKCCTDGPGVSASHIGVV